MKKFVSIVLFFISFSVFSQAKGKVISIKDGDTVVILLAGNTQETLRLAEVDCPESSQAFGKNAKAFTGTQVFGKNVTFYRVGKDRYGRSVAGIFYDNDKYLSKEIVRAGFGWWYFKASKNTELQKLQDEAKHKKLGLWADPKALAPWDFRKEKRKKKTVTVKSTGKNAKPVK
ncbi:thermonuclease family protein [Chryseobacterium gregarium]|uniref:thermonuclease family protein n=1 Tax=Chryseobacterium gregarium TaxID=456299 RepID=UPI00042A64E8|nr:thermonuclease family protein [Chryseobacterium gregarium]